MGPYRTNAKPLRPRPRYFAHLRPFLRELRSTLVCALVYCHLTPHFRSCCARGCRARSVVPRVEILLAVDVAVPYATFPPTDYIGYEIRYCGHPYMIVDLVETNESEYFVAWRLDDRNRDALRAVAADAMDRWAKRIASTDPGRAYCLMTRAPLWRATGVDI